VTFTASMIQLRTLSSPHIFRAKTKIQYVAPGPSSSSCATSGHQVKAVNRFTYLGSDVNSSGYCVPEILRRIGLASSIISQLDRVWRQSRLSNITKRASTVYRVAQKNAHFHAGC